MTGNGQKRKLYFSSGEAEDKGIAAGFFRCSGDDILTSVLREDGQSGQKLVLCLLKPEIKDAGNMNSGFSLFFEKDGVYFELYPQSGNGLPVQPDDVDAYLKRKRIKSLNNIAVAETVRAGFGRVKIAEAQEELILSEDLAITCSNDEMQAYIEFLPPDEGGEALTVSLAVEKLKEVGITHGVSIIDLSSALREKRYKVRYLVARGTSPVNGIDGKLTYHFDVEKKTGLPSSDERGKMDYRELDLFESVKEGQLLITRTLATSGTPGVTVKGAELKPRPGKDARLPRMVNVTVNEDMTEVYAKTSGMVKLDDRVLTVSDVYRLIGDCDLSTGNIDFDGNVIITGAVITGMKIKASGSVTVGGVVGESEITAGGDVTLR